MRTWIRNRQNQVSIALVAIIFVTVSNVILPAYEALSYFKRKSDTLEQQAQQLFRYSLHVRHYEKKAGDIQERLAAFQKRFSELEKSEVLQKQFGAIQRACRLTVVAQEINLQRASSDFKAIRIRQTLQGRYSDQIRYLNIVLQPARSLLLERYHLENRSPLSRDPDLTADLALTLYIPNP